MFKKVLVCLLVVLYCFSMFGCANSKVINGVEYESYGFLSAEEHERTHVKYRVVVGNVVWGTLLFGSVIAPVYFFGFSLYEPVSKINSPCPICEKDK